MEGIEQTAGTCRVLCVWSRKQAPQRDGTCFLQNRLEIVSESSVFSKSVKTALGGPEHLVKTSFANPKTEHLFLLKLQSKHLIKRDLVCIRCGAHRVTTLESPPVDFFQRHNVLFSLSWVRRWLSISEALQVSLQAQPPHRLKSVHRFMGSSRTNMYR